MAYQHGIVFVMHLACYFLLYPLWKKISLFTVGFFILMQAFGIDLIVLALIKGNLYFIYSGVTLLLCPVLMLYLSKKTPVRLKGKKYAGIREYLLLVDTNLKYVIGLFLLSLIVNILFNPSDRLLNYTNLTLIIVFLLSIPFCREMSKLDENKSEKK